MACKSVFLAGACLTVMNISYASTIDIDATVSGWVKHNGETNGLDGSTTNFITGREVGNGTTYSNYFVFDLSGLNSEITSASLKLQNPDNGFYSFDNDYFGTSNCCSYSVTSLINGGIVASDLLPENWSYPYTGTAVWSEINNGTPVNYGSIQMSESSNGMIIEIVLNEIAINDINASINQNPGNNFFAFGGNLEIPNTRVAYAFANTGNDLFSRTLTLTPVPVPPASLLFLSGIAVLWRLNRK